jgi:hypothetical protein
MQRIRFSKRFLRIALAILLIFSFVLPSVHAPFVTSVNASWVSAPQTANIAVTAGNILMVNVVCLGTPVSVSDSFGDSVFQIISQAGTNFVNTIYEIPIGSTGTDAVTIGSTGQCGSGVLAFALDLYSGVVGIGAKGTGCFGGPGCTGANPNVAGNNPITLTIGQGSIIYDTFNFENNAAACPTLGVSNGVIRDNYNCRTVGGLGDNGLTDDQTFSSAGPATMTDSWPATGGAGFSYVHNSVELTTSSSSATLVTSCLGNCGTPAVTLTNTNSTHGFAFNQSLTVLYEFQSPLNGFLLNVTTSLAKSYTNGQTVTLGVYTVASCSAGTTPFSNLCPGNLASSAGIGNPGKGKFSLKNLQVPVSNGQWVAIAVSGGFSPLDLNDTNTAVPLFQTTGSIPPLITGTTASSCACKMGLWAFIIGNVITAPPPSVTNACPSLATLDCILPALVNGLCSNITPSCQTSSALLWILGLTIVSELALVMGFDRISPGRSLPFGETFTLILLIWIFIMTGLSLLFVWVPVFIFMIGALMFSKHTGRFF